MLASHVNLERYGLVRHAPSVYYPPQSSRSEQVCLESSDLLHTHLALAGTHFKYYYYLVSGGPKQRVALLRGETTQHVADVVCAQHRGDAQAGG